MGVGAELAALAAELALDDLRAPVERLAMADVAGIPASGPMEDFLIPDRARIATSLRSLAGVDRGQRATLAVNGRSEPNANAGYRPSGAASEKIPQAASIVEVDLSRVALRLEADREAWQQRAIEPDFTPYFAEALLASLRQVPQANAAFDADGRGIRRYPAVHLGLSLSNIDGASACHAVVRDADTRNLLGLAMEIQAARSQANTAPATLAEATIGLADYGAGSALFAVPVVLPGQVASIRVGAVEERLVVRGRGFALAPTAYVCASIDHRALDGVDAGALLTALKRFLEEE
jgi:pyruvate/2-oxoglutarate dehydrogenase complex dihydrolipoamide acyltransferase (E2) component